MELPGIHDAADQASGRGQRHYLVLSAVRLICLLVAAIVSAVAVVLEVPWLGWVVLGAFVGAAASEVMLIAEQPERDWYAGRAIAESTKTLAWRYAVGAEPFHHGLSDDQAEALLRERVSAVVSKGKDRLDLGTKPAVVTPSMRAVRLSAFEDRRRTYLDERTDEQRGWYSKNARSNASRATAARYAMLCGEFVAIVAAFVAIDAGRIIDFASIVAAAVATVAAWVAIKQYSQLASAYKVAAVELALQETVLQTVPEADWAQAAADAEEAISREHTMWLASRGAE